jgi:hypothetical protein
VQRCGDAHLSNFGLFASPERRLLFDLNDIDETFPGPFEWDVRRLVASLAVAGRENGSRARIVSGSCCRARPATAGRSVTWHRGGRVRGINGRQRDF